MSQSFRDFVELMQEASGDRAKKISRIKADIAATERKIDHSSRGNDRYHRSGEADTHHKELTNLRAQLRRYEPTKGLSPAQKRDTAIKKDKDNKKAKLQSHAAGNEYRAKLKTNEQDQKDRWEAEAHMRKHHPLPKRNDGEDVVKWLDRTKSEREEHDKKHKQVLADIKAKRNKSD